MKSGKGKFHRRNGWGFIYVPSDVCKDSSYPFNDKDELIIMITNSELRVKKK